MCHDFITVPFYSRSPAASSRGRKLDLQIFMSLAKAIGSLYNETLPNTFPPGRINWVSSHPRMVVADSWVTGLVRDWGSVSGVITAIVSSLQCLGLQLRAKAVPALCTGSRAGCAQTRLAVCSCLLRARQARRHQRHIMMAAGAETKTEDRDLGWCCATQGGCGAGMQASHNCTALLMWITIFLAQLWIRKQRDELS